MSDQIQRPTCAVKGLLHGGRAMCTRVINAEFCGNSDPCEHKVDRNALEEKKATVEQNPAPDVAKLIRLLDSARLYVVDVLEDPYSSVSHAFAKADLDQIDAAIATYRKQGGSK